jgi:hypothetical protein
VITHKIKAPSILTRVFDSFRRQEQHTPPALQAVARRPVTAPPKGFDKRRFALHIENVRRHFSVGDRVTYASIPVIQGEPPSALYEIVYIQELWYDVEFDDVVQEPRALLLRNLNYMSNTFVSATASRMRKLTTMEASLVDLRDKPVQGTA